MVGLIPGIMEIRLGKVITLCSTELYLTLSNNETCTLEIWLENAKSLPLSPSLIWNRHWLSTLTVNHCVLFYEAHKKNHFQTGS